MSGSLVQPAPRHAAGPQPASRARPQPSVRTPIRQPMEGRSRGRGRPPPPSTRERMKAAFGRPLDHGLPHTDAKLVELAEEHDVPALTASRSVACGPASEPFGPVERGAERAAEPVACGEHAGTVPDGASWTTRARILRRAQAGTAEAAAAPEAAAGMPAGRSLVNTVTPPSRVERRTGRPRSSR